MTASEWINELEEQTNENYFDVNDYDTYIVAFSGGKDSVACVLHLLEMGIPKSKIELWHHDIDGREGSSLMDWPITPDYCRAFADALEIPIYFSWKVGGFEREMLRENSKTAPTKFETPQGEIVQVGGTRGKDSTRRKFPQVSANLSVRWCSAYLKIDVGATALRNQIRFNNSRTLFISGERAEESASRAKYNTLEPDRTDNRDGRTGRHVDRWRPVHKWSEQKVWNIIERWAINPHPAYKLGWGRVSCMNCIFGSNNQCASSRQIAPKATEKIAHYEIEFETTIHRDLMVDERADKGTAYEMHTSAINEALSKEYTAQIIVDKWTLPQGAFGDSTGPV
jgi:3'-phosphoadenosine 5'-phosphosulfate sulfotransferase (PAPS reductase)/FAD synthetase